MKKIGIIGFGALGQQILGLLTPVQKPDRVLFFDDVLHRQKGKDSFPFDSFLDRRFSDCEFYLGIGYLHLPRKVEILGQLRQAGRRVPPLVHPTCHVASDCHIGDGSVVYPLSNLGQAVHLGEGVLLNNSVIVSHDSHVGDAAYLSPGVVLSGRVRVGAAAFLGSGVIVANDCKVGAHARIGIGTVVTRNLREGASAIGNPLRLLKRPLKLG